MKQEKNTREELGLKLILACEGGTLEDVKKLKEIGADVNYIDIRGNTPLVVACARMDFEKVEYLVKNNADVNAKELNKYGNYYNNTPLMLACANGDEKTVKYLIENNADVNGLGRNMNTPLMFACNRGNIRIINYLLKEGANPDSLNIYTQTALDFAKWNEEIVSIIKMYMKNYRKRIRVGSEANNKIEHVNISKEDEDLEMVTNIEIKI